ncbi:receptor-like protein 6 [Salvia miltiorrhiza]|uniref:receptor-like protein 6 n=1 Tax=Salvia miltiorrhiza TaxID=226208 RepID=UPI0025ABEBB4|nr:receptor-like protein 6 [Salvia miltiorrhiza]
MRFRIMFESAFLILLFFSNSDLGFGFVSGQSEKELLLQFRSSLTYDSSASAKLVHWNESADFCRWEGVECDSSSRVSGLDLSGESISAGINGSSTLFKLSHLQSLSLAQNTLDSVNLPSEFGHLIELRYLNLSSSGFSGQIPLSLSNLTRLVVLDLSNKFYSSLTLENDDLGRLVRNLNSLRELYLANVKISANGSEWSSALSSYLPNLRVLSLSDAHLTGPPDPSLLKLSSLSVIRLDGNTFSSPFPSFLADLPNLRVLSMSSCGLFGVVPRKLFQIKSLQEIDLSNNRALEGSLPDFPVNGSLENLVLSYTRFSGNVPESIGNLRMLSNLDVRSCSFSGQIPSTIKNLNLLVYLDLSVNQFSGSVPSFAFLKNLQVLNLYRNRLTGQIPDSLWKGLENLGFLDLSENSLQGEIPPSLFALPLLKSLGMSNNSFSGFIKVSTNTSSSPLEVVDLSLNSLEGSVPRIFFELRNLSSLSLSSNKFSGSLKLTDFSKLKNLVSLDLSYNKLSLRAEEEAQLSKLFPRLGTLMLASCNLQKLPNLRNQSSLMMLDLSRNLLEGEIPNWLWRVGDDGFLFRFLNLSHNGFSHLQQPYAMRGLDSLDLHSNILVGEIPTPPPSAFYVDFSSNNFTSILPEIGNILKRVMTFSAADNRITGAIPPSFSNATGLQALNLSRNALSGHIPATLGKLSRLGSLDLSFNALDGKIPVELAGLKFLSFLNLSYNHLVGRIPLQKFPESSFIGNDGLCGPPLNRTCHEREMGNVEREIYASGVCDVLSVPRGVACSLLVTNNWSFTAAAADAAADDDGIGERNPDPASICRICYDETRPEKMASASCDHLFCAECWRKYIATALNYGAACLTLPDP